MAAETPIQRFYVDANVFVTGGTGFLGRLLIEKLLRACPEIGTIYMLVREKKGKSMDQRLDELCADQVFDQLRATQPNFRTKIMGVFGDSEQPKLGLSDENRTLLIDHVNIVFHAAASVNFDQPLQSATFINLRGTRELLAICRDIKQLKFVTHVSTSYSHSTVDVLGEQFYPEEVGAEPMIAVAENLNAGTIDRISDSLMKPFPNSYTFTKSLSEELIAQYRDLPIAIFRPAIIVSTYKEPMPGWINNYYGPQGISTGACVGIIHSLHCDDSAGANIVPVDMCVNALIAMPWNYRKKFDDNRESYEIPIVHFESNTYRPITWGRFLQLTYKYGKHYPSNNMIGLYHFVMRKHLLAHRLACLFQHTIPAIIFDLILFCMGRKPIFMNIYKKVHKFMYVISYFSSRHWSLDSHNLVLMLDAMSPQDRALFFCDLRQVDWDEFFKTYLIGCRQYLLKEPMDTLPAARKRFKRLMYVSYCIPVVLACLAACLIYFLYSKIMSLSVVQVIN